MEKTVIRAQLNELIEEVEAIIESLDGKRDWYEGIQHKLDDLNQYVGDLDEYVFDISEVKESIVTAFFMKELEDTRSRVDAFQMEIEEYAEELSEGRALKVLEKYSDLDEVIDKLEPYYENIDEAMEGLEKAVSLLKGIKKSV